MPISINPNDTLRVFSHPPDFGNEFSMEGKNANNINGKAIPLPNPVNPANGHI